MKKLFILLTVIALVSCGICKPTIPIETNTVIEYRDSTVYRDSIIYTPVEVIKEIVPLLDTLKISTSLAEAEVYLDTTYRVLRGEIHNKKGVTEKIKYKDKIVYRDSVVIQDRPVYVEVEKKIKVHPFYEKFLWFFTAIGLIYIILIFKKLYDRFTRPKLN